STRSDRTHIREDGETPEAIAVSFSIAPIEGKLRRQTDLHAEVGLQCCVNVGTQRGVADGVSPVHETILNVAGHSLEPCRNLGERERVSGRALQRIVWKLIVNEGGADTPIGTVVIPAFIGIDEVTLAKTPDLIVNGIQHPQRMPRPVSVRVRFRSDLLAG